MVNLEKIVEFVSKHRRGLFATAGVLGLLVGALEQKYEGDKYIAMELTAGAAIVAGLYAKSYNN